MAAGPAEFETLIKALASDVGEVERPPLEHVAASVRRVSGFVNAGKGASGHAVAVDEPEQFGGTGAAADPAELFLIAVGASLSVTITVHATLADISISSIKIALSGSLDVTRFFTPSAAAGGGFFDLEIFVEMQTTASSQIARDLVDTAMLASPIVRSVATLPTVRLMVNGIEG